jgi:quinol monooxygenase YgiN
MAENNVVYVRLSLALAKPGHEAEVDRLENDLMAFFAKQPGYIHGYRITHDNAETGRIGRLTVWRDEQAADNAAQTDHVLAVRSELQMLIEEEQHAERSWVASAVEPRS